MGRITTLKPRQNDPRRLVDCIIRPLVTEKATRLLEQNQYTFAVQPQATKPEIKAAIELLFNVRVVAVNTLHPPERRKRVGRFTGHKPHYKKAIVTLAQGDKIVLFPEV
jgi:large subunit ribosomal protein L23